MQKVLLIGINARYSHPTVALYYLRNFVRDLPIDIRIEEYTIRNNPEEIAESIYRYNPDAVGLSAYIWNSLIIKQLLGLLQINKSYVVFLGGPDVSYNAEEWMCAYPVIDYIVTGHGEEGFRSLIKNNFNLKENIIHSQNPPFAEIPFPYTDDDIASFAHKNVYYESSRGCPFSCAYCISSCSDQKLEFRELVQVEEEIARIMRHPPKLVKFIDRTFNTGGERYRKIWEMLIARYARTQTTFHFEIHPAFLLKDDFMLLETAPQGLFQFEIGIQSTHREVRSEIGRKGEWEKEKRAIEKLKAMHNIHLHVDLIAGLPHENFEMMGESFNRVYALGAEHFQLGMLKILPGTAIRARACEYQMHFRKEAPYEIFYNKWLTEKEFDIIKKIARLVDALYNSNHFTITMNELCARFSSPWKLYCALAETESADFRDISWQTMYYFIMDFVAKSFPEERDFFHDCIAYDWFSSFNANRVPSILKGEGYQSNKKKVREMLKKFRIGYSEKCENYKNVRIFIPKSEKFRNTYLGGGEAAVFISQGRIEIIHLGKDT